MKMYLLNCQDNVVLQNWIRVYNKAAKQSYTVDSISRKIAVKTPQLTLHTRPANPRPRP